MSGVSHGQNGDQEVMESN